MKTRDRILMHAQEFSQKAGFRGFSYKDLAEKIGIKTAAIHYHFPKKEDLGIALAEKYVSNLLQVLRAHAQGANGATRVDRFINLFRDTVERDKLCLCASISIDHQILPSEMTVQAETFYTYAEKWLKQAILDGQEDGSLAPKRTASALALELRTLIYGAMIISLNSGNIDDFDRPVAGWKAAHL